MSSSSNKIVKSEWELMELLPSWARRKYFLIKSNFKDTPFTTEDLEKFFLSKFKETGDEEFLIKNIGELIAELSRVGLVTSIEPSPEEIPIRDSRRKLYKLVFPEFTGENLEKLFYVIADYLKGDFDLMNIAETILALFFYKSVSDRWERRIRELSHSEMDIKEAYLKANSEVLILYDVTSGKLLTWGAILKNKESNMGERLRDALACIGRLNMDKGLKELGAIGKSLSKLPNYKLERIIEIFNVYDLAEYEPRELGKVYQGFLEYLSRISSRASVVYVTPSDIGKLLVRLLGVKGGATVLDPAVGSGSLLVHAYYYAFTISKNPPRLLGIDIRPLALTLAAMNFIINDIKNFKLLKGDSLLGEPIEFLLEDSGTPKVDYIILDFPWGATVSSEVVKRVDSLPYLLDRDHIPSWRMADWLWIQLATFYCKKKAGIITSPGALSRGGSDREIRKTMLNRNLIEAVIQLPPRLIPGISVPPVLLIINKNKPKDREDKVLMINASEEFQEVDRRTVKLSEEIIEKILDVYVNFKEIKGFSRIVSLDEISLNNYSLNVSLYVFKETQEEVNLTQELSELKKLVEKEKEATEKALYVLESIAKVIQNG